MAKVGINLNETLLERKHVCLQLYIELTACSSAVVSRLIGNFGLGYRHTRTSLMQTLNFLLTSNS